VTLTKRRTVCKTAYLRLWSVLGVRVNNRHVLCCPLYVLIIILGIGESHLFFPKCSERVWEKYILVKGGANIFISDIQFAPGFPHYK
jgi:hypothetical protein